MQPIHKHKDLFSEQIQQRNAENERAAQNRYHQIVPVQQLVSDCVEHQKRRDTAEIDGD